MSGLSTHVLDTALGKPVKGIRIQLAVRDSVGEFEPLFSGTTDDDGRVRDLLAGQQLQARTFRMTFETGPYLKTTHASDFYPQIEITFSVAAPGEHHHIPLLLSPFGYSTYRGS